MRDFDFPTHLYAFLSSDGGPECVIAVPFDGLVVPLIATDLKQVAEFRKLAESVVRDHGHRVRLVKFTGLEEIETITGLDLEVPHA